MQLTRRRHRRTPGVWTCRCCARRDDERGVALAVAVAVAFVVILLSTAAIEQSVNGLTQSAIANKQVSSTDAAEAGIQYETNKIIAAGTGGQVTCPASTSIGTATYQLSFYSSTDSTWHLCSGQPIPLTASSSLLLQATGTTTATGFVGSQTLQSLVNIPAAAASYSNSGFGTAIFGSNSVSDGGGFALTSPTTTGETYTQGTVSCTSGDLYQGDFLAYSTSTSQTDGGCSIAGNLYAKGDVNITAGSGVTKSVYTPSTFSISGGAAVGGNVVSVGNVTTGGGGGVQGTITTAGSVSWGSGGTAAGTIYAAGNVAVTNGTVNTIYAGGTVSYSSGSTESNTIYATGNVTISNGTVANVISNGTVTITGSARVTGMIDATGNVSISSGFVAGILSGGSVTVGGYSVSGTIYAANGISVTGGSVQTTEASGGNITFGYYLFPGTAYVASHAQTISPCILFGGPLLCNYSLPGPFPSFPASFSSSIPSNSSVAASVTSAEPAAPTFPTLNFDKSAWQHDPNFGMNTTFIIPSASPAQEVDECNIAAPNGYQPDPNNIWTQLAGDVESPTDTNPVVLVMPTTAVSGGGGPCAFTWGDDYRKYFGNGTNLKLYVNLAIISPYGINLGYGGVSSGGGQHDLYLIVPSNAPSPPSGVSGTTCPGSSSTGDIQLQSPLTDGSIKDFVYTPDNVCASASVGSSGTPGVIGMVYAGNTFSAQSSYYQQYDASLAPYISTGGVGGGSGSAPTVAYVKKVANPSGQN